MTTQARGYKGKTIIDFESAFGVAPASGDRKGWRVPIKKNTINATAKLTQDDTLTGRRDPVAPDVGNVDVQGGLDVPVDAHNFGLHLRGMFGLPTTAIVVAVDLDAAAVVNKGGGKVGLPSTAHGLSAGAPVVIAGTTNYDGAYTLQPETRANELVILKAYTAEVLVGTETCTLARQVGLVGAARDAGSGKVGLPSAAHGLPVGSRITVDGSTSYDGTYTVLRGSSADELLITKTYAAETFSAGAVTATAPFYDHEYKLGDTMPSMANDKAFPDLPAYFLYRGLKSGKLSLTLGGEGALAASITYVGAGEDKGTAPYVAAPVELPVRKFMQKGLSLTEGGVAYTNRVKTVSLALDSGLDDTGYTINNPETAGERGDITEGTVQVSGDLEALFKDVDLVDKAILNATSSLLFTCVEGGYRLQFLLPEIKYERSSPTIEGPKGVLEKHTYMGFFDSGSEDSCIVVRLRNEIYTWEH